ncbi:hypothetical protein [Flavobacterium sp. CSZ]|uniref:hypothetical protein n=1 Tax=Flavobacterium sp. CSZ TaxID=2783791 RepID=UPI00188C690D|nr:hypothetical protein [Flavobacterium sp. CSZ]MBF4485040.1 hypothetical protein [Flavobacterium sp. CSZ]
MIESSHEPATAHILKYTLNEIVNLYDILPQLSFDVEDILKIISGLDNSNVKMAELVDYFNRQNTQQKYNDYDGVPITTTTITKLNGLIKP